MTEIVDRVFGLIADNERRWLLYGKAEDEGAPDRRVAKLLREACLSSVRFAETKPVTIAGAIAMLETDTIEDLGGRGMLDSVIAGLRAIAEREGIA